MSTADTHSPLPAVGIIGGSGLYHMDALTGVEEFPVVTPYGKPSAPLVRGVFAGREVYFLARHGKGHTIAPHEINHRANLWALRSQGVRWVIAVTAVGSLKEEYRPREAVLPDQFFDRLSGRERHTFFGEGIVAHVGFAEPTSPNLRAILAAACASTGLTCHQGGTYVCMEGPAFSTRAESLANRQLGFDIIGMTNLPEIKLAREAEIAMATLAMVTDYDCWKQNEAPVSASAVFEHLKANVVSAKAVLQAAIPQIPSVPDWPEHHALDTAIVTPRDHWPEKTIKKLSVILDRFVG
ncbi:MAG: S-methyl-5'-thioadenosine phosphorylase [Terrimicrobiaceae bacterium]